MKYQRQQSAENVGTNNCLEFLFNDCRQHIHRVQKWKVAIAGKLENNKEINDREQSKLEIESGCWRKQNDLRRPN